MARKNLDIIDQLHLARARCCAAHAARKRDDKAAVPALIRPDFEHLWPGYAIKPGPVEPRVGVVQFTRHSGH